MKKLQSKINNPFIKNKLNVRLRVKLIGLRFIFIALKYVAPAVAESLALRLFLSPPKHAMPEWQKTHVLRSKQTTIKAGNHLIKLYHWGNGPVVLLIHGWGGRGSQLSAFVNPLIEAGYSVITFDGPAHGNSSGKQCDMFEFAMVINDICKTFLVNSIIAHSFGSACTLLALSRFQIITTKLVLIGCPASAIWITEEFGKTLSISKKIIVGMRKKLELRYENKWTWQDLSLTKLIQNITVPILLIHDKNDREIPFDQALELKKASSNSELFISEGQGHRRILRSERIIHKTIDFIR